jgi:hypothetical protein
LIFDKHANRYISSLTALSIIIAFGLTNLASAQQLDAQSAEEIVRNIYFEGFPEDEAREIGPAGAARLIETLGAPDESSAHANVLLALGLCGQPGALEAIRGWADDSAGPRTRPRRYCIGGMPVRSQLASKPPSTAMACPVIPEA